MVLLLPHSCEVLHFTYRVLAQYDKLTFKISRCGHRGCVAAKVAAQVPRRGEHRRFAARIACRSGRQS